MRAILQRVSRASVEAGGRITGQIGSGFLVLLGVGKGDTEKDADYLADKILNLRVFPDAAGKMNLSVLDSGGALLVVSQFTLYADVRKGRRPSFDAAAPPGKAQRLYEYFVGVARQSGIRTETGVFQAMMQVELVNDGPVTIICDSNRPVGSP
jgi:D-tyrosyl-tRNA(Tyr) deacylase